MKKTTTILSVILLVLMSISTSAKSVKAFLSYSTFYSPQDGPYVETYLSIAASSINFVKNENGKYQGKVEITLIFKDGEKIADHKKLNLSSPEVTDSTNTYFSFIDVQRFILDNGKYTLDFKIKDLNSSKEPLAATDEIIIDYKTTDIQISGIEFIDSYKNTTEENILSKSGLDMIPYPLGFYSKYQKKLSYYSEIYFSKKILGENQKFLIKSYIESYEKKTLQNGFFTQKIVESNEVIPFFHEFPIEELPSGNYNLVVETVDKDNNVLNKNFIFFQRSNPELDKKPINFHDVIVENTFVSGYKNLDSLKNDIKSVIPVASPREQYTIAELTLLDSLDICKKFFYHFWILRNEVDPQNEWLAYKEKIDFVNEKFSSQIFKGYETDRGVTFLKYGAPNTIVESPYGPATAPYEIWHYYSLESKQSNAKFVFYNPDMLADNYQLIHSNVRGEVYNPNWQRLLFDRNTIHYDGDNQEWKDQNVWGEKTWQNYKEPY